MDPKLEKIIKVVYRGLRQKQTSNNRDCPDEETIACFCEGKLSKEDSQGFKKHILKCERCARIVTLYNIDIDPQQAVPSSLLDKARDMIEGHSFNLLEIVLSAKEKFLELISTTGDVILGNEIIPMPVLRSRQIKELKGELKVVKEFKDIRINVSIEKKDKPGVKIIALLTNKHTSIPVENLRISISKGEIELESHTAESGKVIFDNVNFGTYSLLIFQNSELLGLIKIEIR